MFFKTLWMTIFWLLCYSWAMQRSQSILEMILSTDCKNWHGPITKYAHFNMHSAFCTRTSERKGCVLLRNLICFQYLFLLVSSPGHLWRGGLAFHLPWRACLFKKFPRNACVVCNGYPLKRETLPWRVCNGRFFYQWFQFGIFGVKKPLRIYRSWRRQFLNSAAARTILFFPPANRKWSPARLFFFFFLNWKVCGAEAYSLCPLATLSLTQTWGSLCFFFPLSLFFSIILADFLECLGAKGFASWSRILKQEKEKVID